MIVKNSSLNECDNEQTELLKIQQEITGIRVRMKKLQDAYFEKMEALKALYMDARRREIQALSVQKKNDKGCDIENG